MAMNEAQLKDQLKERLACVYVLYGAESYLVEQYMRLIVKQAVGDPDDAFNLHRFDGQTLTLEQLEEATEALPLMAERTCVTVRDMDPAAHGERLVEILQQMPDTCVLVLWQMTVQPDKKKDWKLVFDAVDAIGGCMVAFERKTPGDVAKMLVSGAKRRGCVLAAEDARRLTEQAGNDLNLLLRELDKLVALADGGTITREMIEALGTKNLEARVFDLSKAILQRRGKQAYELLHQLFVQRAEPINVLAVLSNAYADLYRAKVAIEGGAEPQSLAADFTMYKGKEFRLRNAGYDAARMSTQALRDSLDILAQADNTLKTERYDQRVLLEQTVSRLIERAARGE
ncbi:MAG: DNA polymerase III subunit delta [Clostridia bacterium]|nr:DNA polymerase III subunit delta [Clostridia bacterium]